MIVELCVLLAKHRILSFEQLNATYCDEVVRIEEKVFQVKEERRYVFFRVFVLCLIMDTLSYSGYWSLQGSNIEIILLLHAKNFISDGIESLAPF